MSAVARSSRTWASAGAATLALATLLGCEGRPAVGTGSPSIQDPITGPTLVEIDLASGLSELGPSSFLGPRPGSSHAELERALRALRSDDRGVFVRLGTADVGLSLAYEVGGWLDVARRKNLPVVCHADDLSNGSMLLVARGCSEIWLSPAGSVDSVGLAAHLLFGKRLLEQLGVGVDFLQVGKFKGAEEPYTRDEPSPEARSSLEGALGDLRKAWLEAAAAGRGKPVEAALEDGPHTPSAARDLGLIDVIGYEDDARRKAKELSGSVRREVVFGGRSRSDEGGVTELLRQLSGGDELTDPHVAVLRASGAITMGGGGGPLGGADGITHRDLGRALSRLAEDDAVKAVVLRIDSPGGSALASDLLWHELMKLREKKPLVVSIGAMAASGGYYLACAGNRVFAEPTSIVGSIGVVGGKLSLHEPLARLGVTAVRVPANPDPARAARAGYMSPFDRWDDATRAKVLASMTNIYDTFLDRIATGRGLERAVLEPAAEGRIFGGATAKDRRLVDEIGGLDAAILHALDLAKLGPEGAVHVRMEASPWLELFQGDESAARAAEARAHAELDPIARTIRGLGPETARFVESLEPLARGESAVVALPYAFLAP